MTNRAQLRAMVRTWERDHLGQAVFSDEELNQWIADAIAEYSVSFPRVLSGTISTVNNQREYSLVTFTGLQEVVEVEYPTGEDPPNYLGLRARDDPEGFWGGPYWDVVGIRPTTALIIGEKPTTGQTIGIRYKAEHAYPDSDAEALTVPDFDLNVLALFVRWRALSRLESVEAQGGSMVATMLREKKETAAQAKKDYDAAIVARK